MFTEQHIAGCPIHKLTGETTWAVYRPYRPNRPVLDEFENEALTNSVAELIDSRFGGSYPSLYHTEAKRIACLEHPKGETE